jgi:hypothetical protein
MKSDFFIKSSKIINIVFVYSHNYTYILCFSKTT